MLRPYKAWCCCCCTLADGRFLAHKSNRTEAPSSAPTSTCSLDALRLRDFRLHIEAGLEKWPIFPFVSLWAVHVVASWLGSLLCFSLEVRGEAAAAACGERLHWGWDSFSWKMEASLGLRTQCGGALFLDVCTEPLPLAQCSPGAPTGSEMVGPLFSS